MVMDDVIGVAMVMDDVRGSSEDPEEPIVRYLAQKGYFYTTALSEICLSFTVKQWQDSISENKFILIGVTVILCISVAVNCCTITW